jgi:uncharacterized membrane protein YidH (DUF202 family)
MHLIIIALAGVWLLARAYNRHMDNKRQINEDLVRRHRDLLLPIGWR